MVGLPVRSQKSYTKAAAFEEVGAYDLEIREVVLFCFEMVLRLPPEIIKTVSIGVCKARINKKDQLTDFEEDAMKKLSKQEKSEPLRNIMTATRYVS